MIKREKKLIQTKCMDNKNRRISFACFRVELRVGEPLPASRNQLSIACDAELNKERVEG